MRPDQNNASEETVDKVDSGPLAGITWDDFHCSPRAEVILVSKNMVGFRVDIWYMKKHSDFIKELLDLPSSQSIDQAPIHVHQSADIVRLFIDYVTSSGSHHLKPSVSDCKHILDLCDHLQASYIRTLILDSLAARMYDVGLTPRIDAWGIYKIAANQDDVTLAQLAVRHFDKSDVKLRDMFAKESPSFFADIPLRYVVALLRCFANPVLALATHTGASYPCIVFQPSEQAARAFRLD